MSESVVDHYRNAGMAQARLPSELATYVSSMYYVLLTNQVLCSMYTPHAASTPPHPTPPREQGRVKPPPAPTTARAPSNNHIRPESGRCPRATCPTALLPRRSHATMLPPYERAVQRSKSTPSAATRGASSSTTPTPRPSTHATNTDTRARSSPAGFACKS